MATAIELALQRAVEKKAATHAAPPALRTVVEDWSRDDTVHTDPPLPPAPAPQPEKEIQPVTAFDTTAPEPMPPTGTAPPMQSQFILCDPAEVGVTQACFFAVRDNPGALRAELVEALIARGYKRGSVSSLLGTMSGRGIVKVDKDGRIWPLRKRFKPLSGPEVLKRQQEERRKAEKKRNGMSRQEAGRIGGLASGRARGSKNGFVLPPPPGPVPGGKLSPSGALVPDIGRPLTKEESGRLANLVRWNSWDKIAALYGRTFADAKRDQFIARHGKDYVPTLNSRPVQRKAKGVDIDAAHKKAHVVETFPNPAPIPPSAYVKPLDEAARRPDPTARDVLRNLSAAEVIDALSIGQALEVYERLHQYFKR